MHIKKVLMAAYSSLIVLRKTHNTAAMRVVLCAVAVALLTAAAIADDSARQEVAENPASPPPPPNHFLPRPSQILQAFGNYMHQHHQDVAAAHHTSHAQHHVDAHGAEPPPGLATTTPPPPPPAPAPAPAPGYPAAAGPQPPHATPAPPPGHLASHLQQAGISRPPGGFLGGGGLLGGGLMGAHNALPPAPITATRTVFVEITKRVTRHPICMTVYGARPPCLPYNEYKPSPYKKPADDSYREHAENSLRMDYEDDMDWHSLDEGYYVNPTQVVKMGAASAAAENGFMRLGRYIELRKPKPSAAAPAATLSEPSKSDDATVATPALEDAPLEVSDMAQRQGPLSGMAAGLTQMASNVGSMMPQLPLPMGPMAAIGAMGGGPPKHTPETRYNIKTLWVTKVERFTDYRVTATLVAENCVPTDSKIPFCNSGYAGPSYEGGADYAPPPYTEKPHIYTTPKPPKKKPYGHPPPPPPRPLRPHLGLLHRPPQPPPPPPSADYTAVPAPEPAQYPPQVSYEKPYPPKPAPAYPPPPPAYTPPPPAYDAPPPPSPPMYPPAAPAYNPPPPAYEPPRGEQTYDYPVDNEHWKETDNAEADEMAVEQASS